MVQTREPQDVLTSVRRIVGSDATTKAPARSRKGAPALILAPANRITEPEDPFQTVSPVSEDAQNGMSGPSQRKRGDGLRVMTRQDREAAAMAVELSEEARRPFVWLQPKVPIAGGDDDYLEDADYIAAAEQSTTEGDRAEAPAEKTEARSDDEAALPLPTDEAELRKLIAQVVRQELAGELGGRITRNVRKLVRREIRQVLSSGEFD